LSLKALLVFVADPEIVLSGAASTIITLNLAPFIDDFSKSTDALLAILLEGGDATIGPFSHSATLASTANVALAALS